MSDTPSLTKVIKDIVEARLTDLHTAMPGVVDSFDAGTGLAKVKPSLQRKYPSGDVVDLPVLVNVPVLFPRGGNAVVTFDLQAGDPVLLVFCERSIDSWKVSGGSGVDPKDTRKHALSDAVAIPGVYPKSAPATAAAVTLAFKSDGSLKASNASGSLELKASGEVDIATGAAGLAVSFGADGKLKATNALGELVAALSALADAIMASKVATSLGLQPLIPDPTYVQQKAIVDSFKA